MEKTQIAETTLEAPVLFYEPGAPRTYDLTGDTIEVFPPLTFINPANPQTTVNSSNPFIIPSFDTPFNPATQITTLLDLYNRSFQTPKLDLGSVSQTPQDVLVIPASSPNGGGDNSTLIILAIVGIVATVGVVWYLKRKH